MDLNPSPNATALDPGALLFAGASTDKAPRALEGQETFDDLLSECMNQEVMIIHADGLPISHEAATEYPDPVSRQAVVRTHAIRHDRGVSMSAALPIQVMNSVPPEADMEAPTFADSATQLAAQIEAAREVIAHQAVPVQPMLTQSVIGADLAVMMISAQTSGAAPMDMGTMISELPVAGGDRATSLAAQWVLDSVNVTGEILTGSFDAAQPLTKSGAALGIVPGEAEVQVTAPRSGPLPDAGASSRTVSTAYTDATQTPPAIHALSGALWRGADGELGTGASEARVQTTAPRSGPLPDAGASSRTVSTAYTDATRTPPAIHALSGALWREADDGSSAARRIVEGVNRSAPQAVLAVAADLQRNADGDASMQTGTQQGSITRFDGVPAHISANADMATPVLAAGGAHATETVARVPVTLAQALPAFGDVAWPHAMANQMVFMQVHRQSSAELQLSPAGLGGLRVNLDIDNGVVNASFVCQHQAVVELVQDAMPRLREAMQQSGIQLAQTFVGTGDFNQQDPAQKSLAQGKAGDSRPGLVDQVDNGAPILPARRAFTHNGIIDTFV